MNALKMKTIRIILLAILTSALLGVTSCKKKCENCRQFKIYDDAPTGTFESISVKLACGRVEQRKYEKQKSRSSDAGGAYKVFWECGLWEEDKNK